MGTYIPHTEDEVATMLAFLGLDSVEQLFDVVPEALRLQRGLELAPGAGEPDVLAHMEELAGRNRARRDRLVCFAGGGPYDHEIPSVTRALGGRSEFVTSYTPYQPEVAQGVLQAVFEFQTMVSRLAGLPVANASLYDGGSAAVEAVNLAVAATGRQTVWVSAGIHPHWRQMLETFAAGTGHRIRTIPLRDGLTAWPDPDDDPAGGGEAPGVLLVGYPNYLGCIEDLAQAAHALYCEQQEREGKTRRENSALCPWEELPEDLRDANRAQVADIPNKLYALGYELAPSTGLAPSQLTVTPEQLELLSRREHDRWMAERQRQGWTYGPVRDDARKLHPSIIPWESLSEAEKQKDRDTVHNIPELIKKAGFQIRKAVLAAKRL